MGNCRQWWQAGVEVCRLAGIPVFESAAQFDSDATLTPEQMRIKYLIRLAHNHLTPRAAVEFRKRRLQLLIDESSAVYELDPGINPGALKYRSFFNISTGTGWESRLKYLEYNEFLEAYPDESAYQTGKPLYWILLPTERTETGPKYRVRIYPNPDQAYELQYEASLNAYNLSAGEDYLLFPYEYEHVLWEWAWHMLERDLGEGKEGQIMLLANEAFKDVRIADWVATDSRKAVRTMMPLGYSRRRRPTAYEIPPVD